MPSQHAGWASLVDQSPQGVMDRLGLAGAGDNDRERRGGEQGGDRQGVSMRRHIFDRLETTIMNLLKPASVIKSDYLDMKRVEEVGDGWVVEGKVSVLADTATDKIGRMGLENILVIQACFQRSRDILAGDQFQALACQSDAVEEVFMKVAAKARGMIRS